MDGDFGVARGCGMKLLWAGFAPLCEHFQLDFAEQSKKME